MSGIRPAIDTLRELRGGEVMEEIAVAIHNVLTGVTEQGKGGKVTIVMEIKPLGTKGVSDAIEITAEVVAKVPQPELPSTLFFVDATGNPSRHQDRQREIPLAVAENMNKGAA